MSADRLTAYRLLAEDLDILAEMEAKMRSTYGAAGPDRRLEWANKLKLLIGRAKENKYSEP
jgi:hypothetical protein